MAKIFAFYEKRVNSLFTLFACYLALLYLCTRLRECVCMQGMVEMGEYA